MWTLIAVLAVGGFALGLPFAGAPPPLAGPGTGASANFPPPQVALPRVNVWWRLLLLLMLLLYVNQVLFNVYVAVERGGDTDFIGLAGQSAFFHLAPDHGPVRWLCERLSSAPWLEPTVLRVQAVLELPFALSAYLSIAWLLDREAAQRIAGGPLGLLAGLAWTGVLSAIEVLLDNPYTRDDLLLRGVGVLLTAPLLYGLGRRPLPAEPPSYRRLLLFFVGLGALSVLVVGVNAIALLYNLGWLASYAPVLLGCGLLAGATITLSGRVPRPPRSPALPAPPYLRLLHAVGRRFTLLFCVPALAIRYGLSRPAAREAATLSLALVCLSALTLGFLEVSRPLSPAARLRLAAQLGLGLGVGVLLAATDAGGLLAHPALHVSDLDIALKGGLVLLPALLMGLFDRPRPPAPSPTAPPEG